MAMMRARRRLLANLDEEHQAFWRQICSDGESGLLVWMNVFGWVYEPRRTFSRVKHVPYILWPVHEQSAIELYRAVQDGEDRLLDKSRDMGATWLILYVFLWFWMFAGDMAFQIASRKEEYVDKTGDPKTLFWKLDYAIAHQPRFLVPKFTRNFMHLGNDDNGSTIDGESTNQDVGRGGRVAAFLFDEFAAVPQAEQVLSASADVTPCRVFTSTPQGAGHFDESGQLHGNAFAALRFSGKIKVITLPWWEHPLKGKGRELVAHPITGKKAWTSPWYRAECARRASRREIAQEIDIDYLASGDMFFDSDVIARIRTSGDLRPADIRGEMVYEVSTIEPGRSYEFKEEPIFQEGTGKGRLSLWCPLVDGKPAIDKNYIIFCDISAGTGASNSVIRVASVGDREEIAAFVCCDTPPHELARYAVAMSQWFGGQLGRAFLGWEANGSDGEIFGHEVWRMGYCYVLGNINPLLMWHPRNNRVGWHSTRDSKALLLGDYRSALARGEFTTHDEALISETEQYIYYPNGGIGPSSLVAEVEGARAAHGDRVIGGAGLVLCMQKQPQAAPPAKKLPYHSYAASRKRMAAVQEAASRW